MNSVSTCTISSERVNDLDAGFFDIARIPRGNGQAMNERSRGKPIPGFWRARVGTSSPVPAASCAAFVSLEYLTTA